MGETTSKILNHPMPIDHKGRFTSYSRINPLSQYPGVSQPPIPASKKTITNEEDEDDPRKIFAYKPEQKERTTLLNTKNSEEDKRQQGTNNFNTNQINNNNNTNNDLHVTFGQVLLATWLGVLSIVAALSLQSAITFCFKQMITTQHKGWKIFILFLQFILIFSLLIFFAVFFAG